MNKLSSCTAVNFWFRPIGFPTKKSTPTISQISKWYEDRKPNHFKSISPIGLAGELFALIGGISSIFGFSKDNKYAKWGGIASAFAGIALYITAIFKGPLKIFKASEETSKSLKTIADEKDDANRRKMIDDLIGENNPDNLLQTLKDMLQDDLNKDLAVLLEIISHLNNGPALILDIVKSKTYSNWVRRAAVFAIKNTGEEERKVLIAVLKDEKGEFRSGAANHLGEYSDNESYELLINCLKNEEEDPNVGFFSLKSIFKRKHQGYIEDLAKLLEGKDVSDQKKDDILKKILNLPVEEIKIHILEVLSADSKLSVEELKALESANDERYAHLLFNSLGNENISYLSKLMVYDSLKTYIVDKELTEDLAKFVRENLFPKTGLSKIAPIRRTLESLYFDSGFEYLKDCPLSESNIESIKLFKRDGWLFKIKDS